MSSKSPELGTMPLDLTKATAPSSDVVDFAHFIFHYDITSNRSIQHTLSSIIKDLITHNDLHDWDENLTPDPVKKLALFAKDELSRIKVNKADYMVNFSTVQEVTTTNGVNARRYMSANTSEAASQLFPKSFDMV